MRRDYRDSTAAMLSLELRDLYVDGMRKAGVPED